MKTILATDGGGTAEIAPTKILEVDGVFALESAENEAQNEFGQGLGISWLEASQTGANIDVSPKGQPYISVAECNRCGL